MTWQKNQINLTRNNIIIYFYHHRHHHWLFYLVVIETLAFLLHQQRMLSYKNHCNTQHMPAGNDTMIYCVSGRTNNYGESSQSHEKIVGNACERKQIEIFYDTALFCFVFFFSLLFWWENRAQYIDIFSASNFCFFFLRDGEKTFVIVRQKFNKKQRCLYFRFLLLHVQAESWCLCVNHVDETEVTVQKMECFCDLFFGAYFLFVFEQTDEIAMIDSIVLTDIIVANRCLVVDWIAKTIAVPSPHWNIPRSFRHPPIDWT